MGKIFSQFTEEKWEQVRTHPYFSKTVAAITKRAEEFLVTEPPRVKFSQIHLFVTTGNRTIFQAVHSNYQNRMETYFFMYLLTKDEKWIEPLADIIWNICDFEAWSIPAHVAETLPEERRKTWLDLCSTILGFRISEILYFIGDKLPDLVRKRAEYEVRYRVIDSFAKYNDFWWIRATNNWSAVCIASVLSTYLYAATKEEIDAQLPRMIESAKCYLRGIDDEGCCQEGYGYWNYGFSYFCVFASMLRDYTDGEIDMFKDPKVHAIAKFQQNIAINDTQCISFSDCGAAFKPTSWLSQFLKNEYPDIEIPGFEFSPEGAAPLRYILWQDPNLSNGKMNPKSYVYKETQWFIYRSPKYNVAIKAGFNNEPHNHNDVGSFIISKDGYVSFTDPGGGEYTRQYFSNERYDILVTSSRGHSVPIINGQYQVVGKEKSVILEETDNKYSFTMQNAYNIPTLSKLVRTANCKEDSFEIVDEYSFTEVPDSVIERYVSLVEPKIDGNKVTCGTSTLTFDDSQCELSVTTEQAVRSISHSDTLYQINLKIKNPAKDFTVKVSFN